MWCFDVQRNSLTFRRNVTTPTASCLLSVSLPLKIESVCFSVTFVNFYQTASGHTLHNYTWHLVVQSIYNFFFLLSTFLPFIHLSLLVFSICSPQNSPFERNGSILLAHPYFPYIHTIFPHAAYCSTLKMGTADSFETYLPNYIESHLRKPFWSAISCTKSKMHSIVMNETRPYEAHMYLQLPKVITNSTVRWRSRDSD
jgi:hypothetical protein